LRTSIGKETDWKVRASALFRAEFDDGDLRRALRGRETHMPDVAMSSRSDACVENHAGDLNAVSALPRLIAVAVSSRGPQMVAG
jgi:hypothetical protein